MKLRKKYLSKDADRYDKKHERVQVIVVGWSKDGKRPSKVISIYDASVNEVFEVILKAFKETCEKF